MKAIASLPSNYSRYTILESSKKLKFIIGALVTGIAVLLIVSQLLVTFANDLRPTALDGMRLHDMFNSTTTEISFVIPPAVFPNLGFALIAVLILHEFVHGLFYLLFSSNFPRLGFQGLFPYVAAPPGVYFPRNQFIIVGLSPLVLLTAVGMLLVVIVPITYVPFLIFFVAFNTAGAAGDLIMVIQLMPFSSDTFIEDNGSGVLTYGPKETRTQTRERNTNNELQPR